MHGWCLQGSKLLCGRPCPRGSLLACLRSVSGQYPFASLHAALHSLLLRVRDVSAATLAHKLALLLYYLMDLGLLHGVTAAQQQASVKAGKHRGRA